jgi:hypothetical protein
VTAAVLRDMIKGTPIFSLLSTSLSGRKKERKTRKERLNTVMK